MASQRPGQALPSVLILTIILTGAYIYCKQDAIENTEKISIVSASPVAQVTPMKRVAENQASASKTILGSEMPPTDFGEKEYLVFHLIPSNGLFDLSSKETAVKCNISSCHAKLFYRKDATRSDLDQFMIQVQDPQISKYFRDNNIEIEGMSFGTDDSSGIPYFEIFTKDVVPGN